MCALLALVQQPHPAESLQVAAAAVHAVSSMAPFVQHIQTDRQKYVMLATAAGTALQAGIR